MRPDPEHPGEPQPESTEQEPKEAGPADPAHMPPGHTEHGHGPETRLGGTPEAMPPDRHHTTEHESGYGGKKDQPRTSSDQRPGT